MKDLFISYEQAIQLKELGFDEPCLFGYNQDDENKLMTVPQLSSYDINSAKNSDASKINKVTAPLKQQVLRWFREKCELHGYIEGMYPWCRYYINSEDDRWEGHKYNTYEECENSLTNKLIEIVKNKP